MSISYSLHVGGRANSITTSGKLTSVSKHNSRAFESETYNKDLITILRGSENPYQDTLKIYHQEFDQALQNYHQNQKRSDRKIQDYFKYVSESSHDVAVELILQVGDKSFWENKGMLFKRISESESFYQSQLDYLEELIPNFKISNAILHLDESSPHVHVIGVPIRNDCKIGLKKQVSKSSVFTRESLTMLQAKMREQAEMQFNNLAIFKNEKLLPKTQGRNRNFTKEEYIKQKNQVTDLTKDIKVLEEQKATLEEYAKKNADGFTKWEKNKRILNNQQNKLQENISLINTSEEELNDLKSQIEALKGNKNPYHDELISARKWTDEQKDKIIKPRELAFMVEWFIKNLPEELIIKAKQFAKEQINKHTKTR